MISFHYNKLLAMIQTVDFPVVLNHKNCRDAILEICEAGTAAKPSQETTANGQEGGKRYFVLFKKIDFML